MSLKHTLSLLLASVLTEALPIEMKDTLSLNEDGQLPPRPAGSPAEDDASDILTFILVLGITLGIFSLVMIGVATFFLIKTIINRNRSVRLENTIPGSVDDEFEIEERLLELTPNEQNLYRSGQDYIKANPPINDEISLSNHLIIQEKGLDAWDFIPDINLPNDAVYINDKTELNFTQFDYQCSIQANLPIPKINDVYYFEAKLFSIESPEDTIISVGLSTKPYPYFRLPGRHLYSVAYDSNGSRRVNNSFKLTAAESSVFPKCQKGDVIGIGYRVRSGTIFFTRNGKKLSEKSIGGHIKGMKMTNIFPTVGTNNPCSVHVNLGQYGYVLIEANIKKWSYAVKEGTRPPLPDYNFSSNDLLLESSNEDDEDIIDPPDFFSSAGYQSSQNSSSSSLVNDSITLNSLPPEPPIYESENEARIIEEELRRNTLANQFAIEDDVNEGDFADVEDDDEDREHENDEAANEVEEETQERSEDGGDGNDIDEDENLEEGEDEEFSGK